jgi:hypothetical protein
MKILIYHLFAWFGRSVYGYRNWLEKVQDWADSLADRWYQDDAN